MLELVADVRRRAGRASRRINRKVPVGATAVLSWMRTIWRGISPGTASHNRPDLSARVLYLSARTTIWLCVRL
jgi:hypothetical protein